MFCKAKEAATETFDTVKSGPLGNVKHVKWEVHPVEGKNQSRDGNKCKHSFSRISTLKSIEIEVEETN